MEVLRYGCRIPFLCDPPLSRAPISMPSYQGGGPERSYSGPCGQVRSGTSSSTFSRFLQPAFCCVEDLRVLETRHRSLDPQLICGRSSLPHGDHSVCTAVSSSGRLDGLHRPQGSLPAGPCPSGLSSLPSVCGSGQSLPVLCPLLRALHSSSGLLSGHGSCFRHSPLLGYPHEAVPRRLVGPVLVSSLSPPRSPGGSRSLPGAGDCGQPLQVSPGSISDSPIPRCSDRFPGFSVFGARRQASLNRRRISLLRRSSPQFLANASRHSVISRPSCSRWPSEGEVSSAVSTQAVGSGGYVCQDSLVSGLPQGSSVVARPSSSVSRRVSSSDLHRSGLLVRRLGRGLGCPPRFSNRFRPLGSGAGHSFHQRARAPSGARGSSPLLPSLAGKAVSILCDNSTAVSYLRKEGGTRSPFLNSLAQEILRWAESHSIRLLPQFIPGSLNVLADSLSRPHQLPHTEWSLHPEVFRSISRLWPVQIDLFATSANRLCSVFFSPFRDPLAAGTDAFLQCWDGLQAYAFPPWSILPKVLAKLRVSPGLELTLIAPYWPQRPWFADLLHLSLAPPVAPPRPPAPASVSLPLSGSPKASASCLERLRRFTRAAGFSSTVAAQASLSRRPSSCKAYQLKWQVYRQWCHSHGHSSSNPSLAKAADFLCWLHSSKHLGVSSIKGYRSMLSAVFRFQLPSLSSHPVFRDLLRSFALESAPRQLRPPAWDLTLVLRFLNTSSFEPLAEVPLRALTQKVLFLVAFTTAKRVGELQALSSVVTFVHGDACLSYVPDFVAKSESLSRTIPRSFLVRSLSDFAAGLDDDLLLCPVRALRIYLDRLSTLSPLRHRLFVSPSRPSRSLSKNAISSFLRDVISSAGASRPEVGRLRAHDIRSVSTSVAFHRNWSVSTVLESATWASSSVFTSFYLRDLQHEFDGILSRGPFVAAGSRIG